MYSFGRNEKKFSWEQLILGLLLVFIAINFINNPKLSSLTLVVIFAIGAVISGIVNFAAFGRVRNDIGIISYGMVIAGIVEILVGIYFISHLNTGIKIMAIIFAIWFIVDSIAHLITVSYLQQFGLGYFWFSIVMNVIGLIAGVFLLLNLNISMLSINVLISLYLLIAGLYNIVLSFIRS